MCELCDPATRRAAAEEMQRFANRLKVVARHYESLANGTVKPHEHQAIESVQRGMRFIIRRLVDE